MIVWRDTIVDIVFIEGKVKNNIMRQLYIYI